MNFSTPSGMETMTRIFLFLHTAATIPALIDHKSLKLLRRLVDTVAAV